MNKKIWDHPIKAVIFDNDGTLMNTEWAYEMAFEKITGEHETVDMKAQLLGKSALDTCNFLIQHFNLNETPQDLAERRTKLLEDCWKSIDLLPGAEWIVSVLLEKNVPMAIATSSRRHVFEQKSQNHHNLISKMHHIVCGDEVSHSKPNPEIFQLALSKFGNVKPEEALVFEDSPLGIKAANLAGIPSIFVPDLHLDQQCLLESNQAKPLLTLSSLQEFDFNQFNWFSSK